MGAFGVKSALKVPTMSRLLVVCLALVACSVQAADKNLVQLAKELKLHTLVKALKAAELEQTIATGGPFTIFAPTDAAFEAIPDAVKDALKDKTVLQGVLQYHVVSGKVLSSQLSNDMVVASLNKTKIRINIYQGGKVITATGSQVTNPDQMASNGVIHVISRVMYPVPMLAIPDFLAGNPDYSTLVTAVGKAGVAPVLGGAGPFTLFAPDNAAFSKLPQGTLDKLLKDVTALRAVLTYHVVSGTYYSAGLTSGDVKTVQGATVKITVGDSGVMVNNANVIKADMPVTNGVIHGIDTVLIPPSVARRLH